MTLHMLQACLHVTGVHTCGLGMRRSSYKRCTCLSLRHFHPVGSHSAIFAPTGCLLSLTMSRGQVDRVRAAVWKWLCRCPDAIGPVGDTSSDEEFFTPPTSPLLDSVDQHAGISARAASCIIAPCGDAQRVLSPAQTRRLQRRHVGVVRQLTTPPPVVQPRPNSPLKAYQRPLTVYRPSWAP